MSVRELDGVDDVIVLDDGALTTVVDDARSYVALVKPASLGAGEAFIALCHGATSTDDALFGTGGNVGRGGDFGGDQTAATGMTANEW